MSDRHQTNTEYYSKLSNRILNLEKNELNIPNYKLQNILSGLTEVVTNWNIAAIN